jgi:manganese efflux pump family protein
MIMIILLFGMLAGLDNLQVCSSIGLGAVPRARLHRMAVMFSLCETVAPVVGFLAGKAFLPAIGVWSHLAGPAVMIACGLAIFHAALRHELETISEAEVFALPLSLCLDNVIAGAGLSPIGNPVGLAALCIGLMSAAMSCAGLYGAARIRGLLGRVPRLRVEMAGAAYLVVLAFRMLAERIG